MKAKLRHSIRISGVLLFLIMALGAVVNAQSVIYVDPSATGTPDGASWATAYTSLQTAINAANAGDEIRIATSTIMLTATVDMTKDLSVKGGYNTTTNVQDDYTTLDGQNTIRVFNTGNLTNSSLFERLIFTHGRSLSGAGLHLWYSNPIVRDVKFVDNYAYDNGSGSYGHGAAILNDSSSPTIEDCIFKDNTSEQNSGAVSSLNTACKPTFTNVTFENNTVTNLNGGALYFSGGSSAVITNAIFKGNSSGYCGGAIYNMQSNITLTNVVFYQNSSGFGGGICDYQGFSTLTNVLFCENETSTSGGGGMFIWDRPYNYGTNATYTTLNNVTFYGNTLTSLSSGGAGAGLCIYSQNTDCYPVLNNTVFYNNTIVSTVDDIGGWGTSDVNSASTNNASDGTGGNISAGTHFVSLSTNPFTDPTDLDGDDDTWATSDDGLVPVLVGDLYDAGNNSLNSLTTDLAGNTRVIYGNIDIGAYESQETPSPGGEDTGIRLWLRADRGTGADMNSSPVSGNVVGKWYDQSGFYRNGTSKNNTQSYSEDLDDAINFNPTVTASGGGDMYYFDNGTMTYGKYSNTYFAVVKSPAAASCKLFRSGKIVKKVSTGYVCSADLSVNGFFLTYYGMGVIKKGGREDNMPYICGYYFNKAAGARGKDYIYANGKLLGQNDVYNRRVNKSKRTRNSNHKALVNFTGQAAEIISYPTTFLNDLGRQKVNSYLALKYGITLDQSTAENYLASDGAIMWDASVAVVGTETFNNDIFGIGRDDVDFLDQRVSKSENKDGIVTVSSGVEDFTRLNVDETAGRIRLDNLNFQTIANNDGGESWQQSGNPHGFKLLARKWQVQEPQGDGSVGDVYLRIDLDADGYDVPDLVIGTDYYFVIDSDNDGSLEDEIPVKRTVTDSKLYTGAIDFKPGQIFTLASEALPSPAGVYGDMFWYRADTLEFITLSGTSVTTWGDYSGNGHDVTNTANYPEWKNKMLNFNPGVVFDEDNYLLDNTAHSLADIADTAAFDVFAIATGATETGTKTIVSMGGTAANTGYSMNLSGSNVFSMGDCSALSSVAMTTDKITTPHLYNIQHPDKGDVASMIFHIDWGNALTGTTTNNNYVDEVEQHICVGQSRCNSSNRMDGDIGEIIGFGRELSDIERRIVTSYLAVKFGISLSEMNYLASDTTVIFDASTYGSYCNDIFGLAEDDISDLYQNVSTSANENSFLVFATSNDFISSNLDGGRSSLGQKNFVMTGNNAAATTFSLPFFGIENKLMERVWVADVNGDPGSFYVAIPDTFSFPAGVPCVIVSDDETFDVSDETIRLTDDGTYYWAEIPVTANTDLYFTFVGKDYNRTLMRHGKYFMKKEEQPMGF